MKKAIISVAALLALTACGVKDAVQDDAAGSVFPPSGKVTLTANWAGAPGSTKTVRQADGKVYWAANESIQVYAVAAEGVTFTSLNTTPSATASFTGTIPREYYEEMNQEGGKDSARRMWDLFPVLVAIYPYYDYEAVEWRYTELATVNYASYQVIRGERVGVGEPISYVISHWLPTTQTAVPGTFASNLFVSATASASTTLNFHHVTGGLKFSVTSSDINRAELKANGNDFISGTGHYTIAPDGTLIEAHGVDDDYIGGNVVTIQPESGNLVPGEYYYFITWPATLPGGFTLTFYTGTGSKERVITQNLEFKSGRFLVLDDADANIDEHSGVHGDLDPITYDPIN